MVRDTSNLTRFVESASIDHRLIREASSQEFTESLTRAQNRLTESLGETSRGWWVPISHYGNYKNGNGRIYNTRLWENVINDQRDIWCGSPMLTDHPEGDSDGNPRDICGVWLDAKFGEPGPDGIGIVYGLLVPSGRNGEDLQDHLQNGLRIGTSSSGFGKLLPDKVTVDPDTYQIERLADWVLNPSQGTFFSYDESNGDIEDRTLTESEERVDEDYNLDEKLNNNIKEKVVKDSKFTKLEEKKFRRDMESFLESASKNKDPQERLEEFKEIRGWLEEGACPDLKEKVEAKIAEEEAFIKVALQEKVELKEQLGVESTKDLKEKLTKIVQDQKILEKESKNWKEVSEKLQERLTKSEEELKKRATPEFTEFQKEKIGALNEKIEDHDRKSAEAIKDLMKSYKTLKESCEGFECKAKELEDKNSDLEKQVEGLTLKLSNADANVKKWSDHYSKVNQNLKEAKEAIAKYKVLFENQRKKFEESIKKIDELRNLREKDKNQISALTKELKESQTALKRYNLKEMKERRANMTDCEAYYEELYRQYGNEIVPFKEQIANASTLPEAKKVFFQKALPSFEESQAVERARIPESLYISPEERARAINGKAFRRQSVIDKMPKGWK